MIETVGYSSIISIHTDSPNDPDIFAMRQKGDGKMVPMPGMEGAGNGTISTGNEYTFSQTGDQVLEPVYNPPATGPVGLAPGRIPASVTGKLVRFHETEIELRNEDGTRDPIMMAEITLTRFYDIQTRLPLPLVVFFPFCLNAFSVTPPPAAPENTPNK